MKAQASRLIKASTLMALASFVFVGCTTDASQDSTIDSSASVIAKITKIEDTYFLVEPITGSEELNSSDVFSVSYVDIEIPEGLEVGDQVEIFYNGQIQETSPAILDGIKRIEAIQ